MTTNGTQRKVTRAEFLRTIAAASATSVLIAGSSSGATATSTATGRIEKEKALPKINAAQNDTQTVVDFDWSYPECPDEEIGELNQYFFGDVDDSDGFHIDNGSGARESPDGCVLRTDGDEVVINSLPNGHSDQPDTLENYPERGEIIVFEHYVHNTGANMEFRFGVQEAINNHYAVRFESDTPAIFLLRVEEGLETELDTIADFSYSTGNFHSIVIEWEDDEIIVTLFQEDSETTISAHDEMYDFGGIGFYKEGTGTLLSYTHLWNNARVTQEFEFEPEEEEPSEGDEEEDIVDEDESEEPEEEDVAEEDEDELSDEEIQVMFESVIGRNTEHLTVRAVERHQDNIVLEYETESHLTVEEVTAHVGTVAGAFAGGIGQGWEVEYLFVYVYERGETVEYASYEISGTDAQAWNNGEISDEEYFERVIDTIEVYD